MAKKNVEKTMADISFEDKIWKACDKLWGHIPASDYRKVVVGLIFLRYVSDAFMRQYDKLVQEGDGFEDDRDAYEGENIMFVPKKARWPVIAKAAHSPDIGIILDDAMRAIEKENTKLKDVLPKIYAGPAIDKRVLGDVVDLFTNEIPLGDVAKNQDLLGRCYQYCIKMFAAHEGQKGGEFYTPECIVKLLVEVLEPQPGKRIYDPCCGSGGMFVQSAKFVEAHSGQRGDISIFGQEAQLDTWRMAKMNLTIRGLDYDLGDENADTFFKDKHPTLKADYILANPPFNLKEWGQEKLTDDVRWQFGVPPAGNANYGWIQHMIHHLSPTGKIGLVLANGALTSQTGGEGEIRKRIVDADLVEAIVALPAQLFFSVQIPVSLWFFNKAKRQRGKTVFVDARNLGHMMDRTHKEFSSEDIAKVAQTIHDFQQGKAVDEKGFAAAVTTEEIAKQDYMLTPGRYVGVAEEKEDGEPISVKLPRLQKELAAMFEESHRLESEITRQLGLVTHTAVGRSLRDRRGEEESAQ